MGDGNFFKKAFFIPFVAFSLVGLGKGEPVLGIFGGAGFGVFSLVLASFIYDSTRDARRALTISCGLFILITLYSAFIPWSRATYLVDYW